MKNKVALCLFGNTGNMSQGGQGAPITPLIAYSSYERHILEKNDVDVFIHTWSVGQKEVLSELYCPVRATYEKQIQFSAWPILFSQVFRIYPFYRELLLIHMRNNWIQCVQSLFLLAERVCSRWYASKAVLELKKAYEEEFRFVYDYVMVSRFDVSFFTDISFHDYAPDSFYSSFRNLGEEHHRNGEFTRSPNLRIYDDGLMDLWFFSNSNYMDKFGTLYDNMKKYSVHPCFASKQHIQSFTNNLINVFYYGRDYDLVRNYFFH